MRILNQSEIQHLLWGEPSAATRLSPFALGQFIKKYWHISGYLANRLAANFDFCINDSSYTAQELKLASGLLFQLQMEEACRVTRILKHHQINHALLKGGASSLLVHAPGGRLLGDLDIAIENPKIYKAREVLEQSGYYTCGWNHGLRKYQLLDRGTASKQEVGHYQLAMLVRRRDVSDRLNCYSDGVVRLASSIFHPMLDFDPKSGKLIFSVELDLHHAIASNIGITDEIETSVLTDVVGGKVRVANAEATLAHTIFKLYYEGAQTGKGGHQFVDAKLLALKLLPREWPTFWQRVSDWHTAPSAYYILMRLFTFDLHRGEGELPHECIQGLVEAAAHYSSCMNKRYADLGDPWDRIWGWNLPGTSS